MDLFAIPFQRKETGREIQCTVAGMRWKRGGEIGRGGRVTDYSVGGDGGVGTC
jgi:hypothetical protein